MIKSFTHIKLITLLAILIGIALGSVHHHDLNIHSGEVIVESGDIECTMCEGTVKMGPELLSISAFDFIPISTVSDGIVLTANLPFERITKERAPPTRA